MLGIVGGSGLYALDGMKAFEKNNVVTEYGDVVVHTGELHSIPVAFLCRHGEAHKMPPHKINYRANIAALASFGVDNIIATNAVGGIHATTGPGSIILPDQVIDYSYGREHTFFDCFDQGLRHIDFTYPFDPGLIQNISQAFTDMAIPYIEKGVYACTQGPRLESAAEICRLEKDGCSIVGMTLMPEAALAREKNMAYASICFSVNWAAGIAGEISMEDILQNMSKSIDTIKLAIDKVCRGGLSSE